MIWGSLIGCPSIVDVAPVSNDADLDHVGVLDENDAIIADSQPRRAGQRLVGHHIARAGCSVGAELGPNAPAHIRGQLANLTKRGGGERHLLHGVTSHIRIGAASKLSRSEINCIWGSRSRQARPAPVL